MSGIGAAIIGGSAITGLLSANAQKDAASKAAAAQLQANQQALAAQQQNYQQGLAYQNNAQATGTAAAGDQNASLQKLLAPFVAAGTPGIAGLQGYATGGGQAFQQQLGLAGALGADAQSQAINGLQNSPLFQQLAQQGDQAILQNASATGGLRGGNVQGALAQFNPALLQSLLQTQFQNLGALSSQGSAAANALASLGAGSAGTQAQGTQQTLASLLGLTGQTAGNVANLSNNNASSVSQLLTGQGAIAGQNALAQGQADANLYGGIGKSIAPALNLASLLASRGGGSQPAATAPGALSFGGLSSNWGGFPATNAADLGSFASILGGFQ